MLGVGIILLIAGASSHVAVLVIIGLIAGAGGIWRLVTTSGKNTNPPGHP